MCCLVLQAALVRFSSFTVRELGRNATYSQFEVSSTVLPQLLFQIRALCTHRCISLLFHCWAHADSIECAGWLDREQMYILC